MSTNRIRSLTGGVTMLLLLGCGASIDSQDLASPVSSSLAGRYQDYFLIGATADSQSYQTHAALLKQHFNSFTTENEMKFESLHPSQGRFDFTTADAMLDFARVNSMTVRGHALVWHRQTPDWVFSHNDGMPRSKQEVLDIMTDHIQQVVGHFKGRVDVWDVVNEAVADDGQLRTGQESHADQNSLWYQRTGDSYIAQAFRTAHAADPGAKLFYNDYYNYLPARQQGIYQMLKTLLQDGVPIHGVGLQAHINTRPSSVPTHQSYHQRIENLERAIQLYGSLGLEVQITELDMSLYVGGQKYTPDQFYTATTVPPELFAQQARRYADLFAMLRRNSALISSVTFWGIADDNTWLSELDSGRADFPLLFDAHHQPKPAYFSVMEF